MNESGRGLIRDVVTFLVRLSLVIVALVLIRVADETHSSFQSRAHETSQLDAGLWVAWVAWAVAAGLVLGLAVSLPQRRIGYRFEAVLLVALPMFGLLAYSFLLNILHSDLLPIALFAPDPVVLPYFNYGPEFAMALILGFAVTAGIHERPGS